MKKKVILLLVLFTSTLLFGCNKTSNLPKPELSEGIRGDLGIDKNINEDNIDDYLNREDAVYRDMRMLIDDAEYEAIGGDSFLSGFVKGFEVVPYPYLCDGLNLPSEVKNAYDGDTLFSISNGEYLSNYKESMTILESLFPKDKYIFLMCGGGGYAGMTKNLLVNLGWDEDKIYNVGGYWYYNGKNKVNVKYEEDGETLYNFALVNYHPIVFDSLTYIGEKKKNNNIDDEIGKTNFIKLESLSDLQELENNHKTFPLFVFLSGCPTCAEFLPIVKEFSKINDIEMYSIDLNDIWGTNNSITDRIKYAPSLFIYRDGEVIDYLNPSSDEDKDYYKNINQLTLWVNSKIDISLFEKCSKCTVQ